jgi:RNA recognition motif-containing protein
MNIYVGNLSLDVTEQELRLEFGTFGPVNSVVVISDKSALGRTGSHAFVDMTSKTDGAAAIAGLQGKRLKDRPIDIVAALPLSDKKMASTGNGRTDGPYPPKGRKSH